MQKQYQINWQKDNAVLDAPAYLHAWLLHSGSFMQRLKQSGANDPQVSLLQQGWEFPMRDEKRQLGMNSRSVALIREVIISSAEATWMFARTVIPRETLTGKQRCLSRLKNRSLGSVLFSDPLLQRSKFDLACIVPNTDWHNYIEQKTALSLGEIWGRSSLFLTNDKPVLLTEYFLPDMVLLCSKK